MHVFHKLHRTSWGKYLTFALAAEQYGIQIHKVREIVGYMDVTAIPRTPPSIKGVINLRGSVINVIDLRTKFGLSPCERSDETCIIVVETTRAGQQTCLGLIVDRVREVLNIAEESIEDPPSLELNAESCFIMGIGKVDSEVKILLDIDKVLQM